MLSLNGVSVVFGATPLFSDLSFQINAKERIALAGRNGAGKTTLLNILAQKQAPTSGNVSVVQGVKIGYLPQHLLTQDGRTVRQEARLAFRQEIDIQNSIHQLSEELSRREDHDSPEYLELVQRLSNQTELLALYNPEQKEAEIERILKGLGFEKDDLDRQTNEFSGGWRMRIELAKILLSRPDLLLLDEPTNHLDMGSIIWLENFIKSTPAAVVIVSHDRSFLDNTTTRTIEISLGKAHDYKTNYSHYERLRQERYEQQKRAYENQQKMIKETEDFIERFRYKATKSVQVQSRIKQLEKIEQIEVEELDRKSIHFTFPMNQPSGAYPLIIDDLKVSYGEDRVLDGIDLTIERGDKIALLGKNGSGKTTFLRSILEEIPYEGSVKKGHNVDIAYFAQNQAALLDPNKSIYQTIDDIAVGEIRTRINDILGAFMFGGEIADKKVAVLSGGERSRLAMIRLLLSPSNLLVLDEPTNHLDLRSKSVLKEAIKKYEGTVLLVSHDRDFLNGLVDKVIEFKHKKIIKHLGGMDEYLRKLQSENEDMQKETSHKPSPLKSTTPQSTGKEEYLKQKEQQKKTRHLQQQLTKTETNIETYELEIKEVTDRLSSSSTPELLEKYNTLTQLLHNEMNEWERLSLMIEEVTSSDE